MQGERRTVTMLFADIQGSTAAAEGLDPEDWAEIVNGAFERLIAPVYRYEGTLARLQGDAVLAFFGAPVAHEDDPLRAVRAGLDIIEGMEPYSSETLKRWGVPVSVRVGINTGLVVVGDVGSDLKVEYTALGDAINVAARMEQTAEPGTVRVTGETWGLVSGHFDGENLGPVEVKGKSEAVVAVRVIGLRDHVTEATQLSVLLGRSDELLTLQGSRQRLLNGTGSIISIMGEAGVGKTRLLEEFSSSTTESETTAISYDQPGDLAWMAASSRSYDSSVPYSTIRDLLTRWWRLDEAEDPFQRVQEAVAASLSHTPDAAAYLGQVSGVPLSRSASDLLDKLEPPVLHRRAREAMLSYIEAELGRRPVVIAMEDIHWADALSLTLLEDLMRLADRAPLGLLFSMRPYRDEPTWRIHEVAQRDHPHRYVLIDLASLEKGASEELLDTLLEGVSVPPAMRRNILERAAGNPLFIEQMARAIRDTGADVSVQVPTGLSSLLTARLDRLDEGSRLVAQVASVIGSEFDRSALASLLGDEVDLDQRLTDLLRKEIVAERPDAVGVLAFHHALMQDAAYSTMLLRTRRNLHHRMAEYLVAASPDASQEIARHFLDAGDMRAAFPHLIAAGESSSRSMALSDAIKYFTTALDNIPADADPGLVVKAHDGLGVAYSLVPDLTQSAASYQRLVDYADSAGRPSAKVKALNSLALNTATLAGDLPEARRYLDQARALAQEVGDGLGLAEYHMNACTIAGLGGDIGSAVFHDGEIAKAGQNLGASGIRVEGLMRLAVNKVALMDFEGADEAVDQAIEAAKEAKDDLTPAVVGAMASSRLRLRDGDSDGALQLLLEGEETLTRYASFYAPLARTLTGSLLYDRGDVEAGILRLEDTLRSVIDQGMSFFVAYGSAELARMYASLRLDGRVTELRTSAIEAVGAPLGEFLASSVWAGLGHAKLAMGEFDQADDDFRIGLEASSASQYWERPRLLTGRALALTGLGEQDDAHRWLDEAQTFVLEKEVRIFDAAISHARGVILLAEGKPGEALARLAESIEVARSSGLRHLFVQASIAAARAALATGEKEAAGIHVAAARAEVESIAHSITDDDLRSALETAWLSDLEQTATG